MEPPSSFSVSISNSSGRPIDVALLERAIVETMSCHCRTPGLIDVVVADRGFVHDLNSRFRGIDEPTDVLTFVNEHSLGSDTPECLGSIAISWDDAEAQARSRGAMIDDEVAYLGIHGALHLCGFDDVEEDDRAAMQREMARMGEALHLSPEPAWTSLLYTGREVSE